MCNCGSKPKTITASQAQEAAQGNADTTEEKTSE